MSANERLAAFTDRVCGRLFWPSYRARVRRELTDHILCRADYLQHERGFSEEEAVAQAIRQLGDPDTLSRALRCTCRPFGRTGRLLLTGLIWAAILCCAGFLLWQLVF